MTLILTLYPNQAHEYCPAVVPGGVPGEAEPWPEPWPEPWGDSAQRDTGVGRDTGVAGVAGDAAGAAAMAGTRRRGAPPTPTASAGLSTFTQAVVYFNPNASSSSTLVLCVF